MRDYVPLGKLEVGTVLHVQGGGDAVLVSKTWRQGEFEVFDFEVEGLHNFYVRGEGSDAAGVLVHNSTPSLPKLQVSKSGKQANIADNIEAAQAGGAPNVLNRETSKAAIKDNRKGALRGQPSAGPGMSLDEYPFASTKQGGAGARVQSVPRSEQCSQGGCLSSFYRKNNIQDGDAFQVEVVP